MRILPQEIKKQIIHFLLVVTGFIFVFTVLYFKEKGQSGGDIALVLFTILLLVGYTIIIGVMTFKWNFTKKIGLIIGLIFSYLTAYFLVKLLH